LRKGKNLVKKNTLLRQQEMLGSPVSLKQVHTELRSVVKSPELYKTSMLVSPMQVVQYSDDLVVELQQQPMCVV
jgi:hypothetical protein